MKKTILSVCLSVYFFFSYSQNPNMFYSVLDECFSYCIDSLPTTYKIDYVSVDDFPRYFVKELPENIQGVTLLPPSMLSLPVRRQMQRIFRKEGVNVLLYDGINLVQDTLTIKFSFRRVQRKRKETNIAISDGIVFYYCYSQVEQKWVRVKRRIWGI